MAARGLGWLRDEVPFLLVVTTMAVGVVYLVIQRGQWRPATTIMAAALLAAAVLRLTLPTLRAGSLAVRRRWWDVVCYAAMGGVILALDIRLR